MKSSRNQSNLMSTALLSKEKHLSLSSIEDLLTGEASNKDIQDLLSSRRAQTKFSFNVFGHSHASNNSDLTSQELDRFGK